MLNFEELSFKDKMTIVCGIIVLAMIVFVFITGFDSKIPDRNINIDNDTINEKIDNLGDNYILNITETTGEFTSNYIFYNDGKLKLYESDQDVMGYLEYNDNMFIMNSETMELSRFDGYVSFIKNPYYDYELIKEFTKSCDYKFESLNNVSCSIPLNTYLNYHNSKYGTSYSVGEGNIELYISYVNNINKMKIDYSSFNKFINQSDEDVIVDIKFKYGVNNFDAIYDNYKDILEG